MERKLSWFVNRIGKRVFRTSNGCPCPTCQRVLEEGLVIHDDQHARYLYDWEGSDDEIGGVELRYFDTKEEVDQYLASKVSPL